MKKTLLIIGLVSVVLFPAAASAKNISELKIFLSDDINKDCKQPDGYDPIRACYHQELYLGDIKPAYKIYISKNLPSQVFGYVLLREIGHFYTYEITGNELKELFNPTPDKLASMSVRQIAADNFVTWFFGGYVPPKQAEYFKKVLMK
jgi:hypothetical protein